MRLAALSFICLSMASCNSVQYQQARRTADFHVTQDDFDSIARATFKLIDAKHDIGTVVAPITLDCWHVKR